MKLFLNIIGFAMFASAIYYPLVAVGQESADCEQNQSGQFPCREEDVPFSSARIFSKMVEATGADPNADWGSTFGSTDEEDVGQDLYALIYDKVENEPDLTANQNVAKKYGLNKGDLNRILNGDYSSIVERRPTMTQEELISKVQEIQNEKRNETQILRLEANVKASVESTEIFANDDLGDSGFDLINDLRRIEELLFLKTDPIDIGQSYSSSDGGVAPIGQADPDQQLPQVPGGAPPASSGTATSALTEGSGSGSTAVNNSTGGTPASPTSSATIALENADDSLNPNSCFAGNLYADALDEFSDKAASDPTTYKDSSNSGSGAGNGGSGSSGSGSGGTGSTTPYSSSFPNDPLPQINEDRPPLAAAPAGDWSGGQFCDDVLCLEVNVVSAPVTSAFQNSDNCIACHAEKIRDILGDTVSHSLVPSKAPGNLGEPGMCKKSMAEAFSSINMEVYAIFMPVPTPANDTLIVDGSDYEEEYFGFCSNSFFPFDVCASNPPNDERTEEEKVADAIAEYTIPPILEDRAAKKAITQSSVETTQAEVTAKIQDAIRTYTIQRNTDQAIYEVGKDADESIIMYGPLAVEMTQMNYYFSNMRDILHSLHEKIEQQPGRQACTELYNKKQCE